MGNHKAFQLKEEILDIKRNLLPCGELQDHKKEEVEELDWTSEGSR